MTSIIDDFDSMIQKAVSSKNLQRLEEISMTILDYMNIPCNFASNRKLLEDRQLNELFKKVAVRIIQIYAQQEERING